jgi:hypothetical protein
VRQQFELQSNDCHGRRECGREMMCGEKITTEMELETNKFARKLFKFTAGELSQTFAPAAAA